MTRALLIALAVALSACAAPRPLPPPDPCAAPEPPLDGGMGGTGREDCDAQPEPL